MTFEVPVSAVSGSRAPRGVLAVAAMSIAIVVAALVAAILAPPSAMPLPARAAAASSTEATSAAPAFGLAAAATPPFEPASFNRPLPTLIDCHQIGRTQCNRVVRAALRVLPDELPVVGHTEVWGSLVCNDNFDCPADYLKDAEPVGSVFVGFGDGSPGVTVNVVDWGYGTGIRLGLRAWLVPTF
jgi:hypothetical protein